MPPRSPTLGEEIGSSITHGAGLVGSIIALPFLVLAALPWHDPWRLAGAAIFGTTLILLYGASTIYHALPPSRAKNVFRVLDHSAIYLLIAGTYTPFTIGALRGRLGWGLLAMIWTLAALGICFKTTLGFRYPHVSTGVYVVMGWLIIVAIRPLAAHVGAAGIAWLIGGGLSYTAGVLFYAWERLRYGHMVWHLFVAAGSLCHFFAVLWYAGGLA
ncbi:MAG: hemolysin III family protein [Gemmatimonadota bacterium]|nr:hemolysin III family protein [Gemmatimonadota bacterium]